jgi:hypothetical protein
MIGGWSPKVFEPTVVRDNIAGVVGKNSKQPIFGGGQFNLIPIDIYEANLDVYGKRADGDPRFAGGPAQIVSYRQAGAHQEIIQLEGLDEVIVTATPQTVTLSATFDRPDRMMTGTFR